MDLKLLRDRRVLIAAAAGVLVLLAGLGAAVMIKARPAPPPLDTASSGSLQVEMGKADAGLDVDRPLRCFVGGQFVGMVSLGDCARRNGVAPGGLNVGLDPTGEVAGAVPDADVLQPLPSAPEPPPAQPRDADADSAGGPASEPVPTSAPAAHSAACWRFVGDWRKVADQMTLDACVQALFAGRCERPGAADYGRWDTDTLRLVTGRVERAADNRTFRPLVKQWQEECAIPNIQE